MKKYAVALITIVLMMLSLPSCRQSGDAPYRNASGNTWGTFYHITYKSATDLGDSITAVMKQIDMSLSPFAEGSLLWRINHGEDAEVDSLFVEVFNTAQQVSALSGGCFDPTVAPLVNLWGFGYGEGVEEPTDEQIAAALATVGIARCTLADGHVVKKDPATEFDFSAIAKGYGCDVVARMLERNGCCDYLVEIGGEIALKGVNDRGEKWHVQIDAPVADKAAARHEQAALISLSDCGVASSGNYRNYRDTEHGRVGHTISPVSGRPVQTELLAVTVIAPDAMWADALATACMAMPLTESRKMIESLPRVEALFITASPDGYKLTATEGFPTIR